MLKIYYYNWSILFYLLSDRDIPNIAHHITPPPYEINYDHDFLLFFCIGGNEW